MDAFQSLLPAIPGLNNRLERSAVATDLAGYLGVETSRVLDHLRRMAADRLERGPVARTEPAAHSTDKILLPLLLANEEARPQLVAALRELGGAAGPRLGATRPLYEVVMQMHEAGEPVSFVAVHERLTGGQQELLQSIVLEAATSGATLEDGLACIAAWKRESHGETERDLKAQIKQAERDGRIDDALRLMKQLGKDTKS
jgi:hypothetical protein